MVTRGMDSLFHTIQFYNEANEVFLTWLADLVSISTHGSLWKYMIAFKMLMKCTENYGIAMALGIEYYSMGNVSTIDFIGLQ